MNLHIESVDASVKKAFTPTGKLRASINLGNPILVYKDEKTGAPAGVSVDLARAFAELLGVELELVVFGSARESVDAVSNANADIGFFAIDPLRANAITFTDPYVLIEGAYLVANDSPLTSNDQVDAEGVRVVVGNGSAYDLYLTRTLKNAQIVRAATSPAVVDTYIEQQAEVAAGVKQQLEVDAKRIQGLRLLPGNFMVIKQAMGCPKVLPDDAHDFLAQFVEQKKRSSFVADALARHHIQGASVAPAKE